MRILTDELQRTHSVKGVEINSKTRADVIAHAYSRWLTNRDGPSVSILVSLPDTDIHPLILLVCLGLESTPHGRWKRKGSRTAIVATSANMIAQANMYAASSPATVQIFHEQSHALSWLTNPSLG